MISAPLKRTFTFDSSLTDVSETELESLRAVDILVESLTSPKNQSLEIVLYKGKFTRQGVQQTIREA